MLQERSNEVYITKALARFLKYCRFEPETGCVLWTGGTTHGHGKNDRYGSFWFDGRRWYAHRWAAVFVHRLEVGSLTVGHCCHEVGILEHPNTLCVQHVQPQTLTANVVERNVRWHAARKAEQTREQLQYWALVTKGYEQAPEAADNWIPEYPRFDTPHWMRQGT